MELLCFLFSIFVINYLNLFTLFLIIFSFLMCRYYYKKYLFKNKYNIRRKHYFVKFKNNCFVKLIVSIYDYFNKYFNFLLDEVYKMFYDLIFEIITNNYKRNFQIKKTENLKIKKSKNLDLVKQIKEENELNSLLDEALKEILD